MARSALSRSALYGSRGFSDRLRLWSEPLATLKRRLFEAIGFALVASSLLLFLALITYDHQDPSLDTAIDAVPRNFLGSGGAFVSDLLLQGFGIAALLLPLILLGWSVRFLLNRTMRRLWLRIVPVPLALLLGAFAISVIELPRLWLPAGSGGAVGWALHQALYRAGFGAFELPVAMGAAALLGLLLLLAIGLSWRDWREIGEGAGRGASRVAVLSGRGTDAALRLRRLMQQRWQEASSRAQADIGEVPPSSGAAASGERLAAARTAFRLRKGFVASLGRLGRRSTNSAGERREPGALGAAERAASLVPQRSAGKPASAGAPESDNPETGNPESGNPGFGNPGFGNNVTPFSGAPARPRLAAEEGTDADPPPATPRNSLVSLVVPRRKAIMPGKRAEQERQATLDLVPDQQPILPPLDLLAKPSLVKTVSINEEALEKNARLLETVLDDFGVRGQIVQVRPGPVVTLYELEPAPGIKASRIIGLADDIARSMCAISVRVAVVPGRNVIGIELPNAKAETVLLRELLDSPVYEQHSGRLALILGKDIGGEPVIADLAKMPHLLIAGTTGSGKSVGINTMILSILYRMPPDRCKFIMIDPKMLELSVYDGIPHLLSPVVTEPRKAILALKWVVREMENRYRKMSKLGVRNIEGFNSRILEAVAKGESLVRRVQTGFDPESGQPIFEEQPFDTSELPFIVVVVDEMADLMLVAGKDIEAAIQRLAQMARAAGIHIIMATQRPSVDVITGTIKANFPTRISFQVTSKIDSRTILGEGGAEQLLGRGDMLYMAGGGRITRVHGPFVKDEEVERVVNFLKARGEPDYVDEITEEDGSTLEAADADESGGDSSDTLYDQAVALVCRERKASTSFVQRHLQIGYNRAARVIERMEAEGVVSAANHVGKREVLARKID